MAEGDKNKSAKSMDDATRKQLSETQENILSFLERHGPQTALYIAKDLKTASGQDSNQARAKDVNKDLYALKAMGLLNHCNKLWSVTDAPTHPENTASGKTNMAEISGDGNLTDIQTEICQFLKDKGPQETLDIAKGLKMESRKCVNPDLHKLKAMGVVHCENKRWSLKESNAAGNEVSSVSTGNTKPPAYTYQQINVHSPFNQIGNYNVINKEDLNGTSDSGYQNAGFPCIPAPCNAPIQTQCTIIIQNSTFQNCMLGDRNIMTNGQVMGDTIDSEAEQDTTHSADQSAAAQEPSQDSNTTSDNSLNSNGINDNNSCSILSDGENLPHQTPATAPYGREAESPHHIFLNNCAFENCKADQGDSFRISRDSDSGIEISPPRSSSPSSSTHHPPSLDISDICRELEVVYLHDQ